MTQRNCPSCGQKTIPVSELLVSDARCPGCRCVVGPQRLIGALFFIVTATATAASTLVVMTQFGLYAAILWFSFPIGAIGYLRARLSPLRSRRSNPLP